MSDFSIRLARASDADAFFEIEDDAAGLLRSAPSLQGIPIPPTATADQHAKTIAKGRSLAALVEDKLVGFAASASAGRELHLHELSVLRAHQQRGIGATLLRALKIDARNSGFRAITLSTFRQIPWNAPFYERHGFVEVQNFEAHPHLQESLEDAVKLGIPAELRCAMIHFLD
ncbi:GNAT family N-acetyltransferase [Erythrobacter sp. MTPC3]|uniref:GNAT family N-acetyltransferase n=1 Tax=Erythrobacter sp. MTPC3 TaxID=3056564 RepID=UPI0036F2BB0A